MDSRLKERLIGAAVLVVLGVLLIPWVLDGPDSAGESADSDLSLPTAAETVPVRTQTIDLKGRRYAPEPDDVGAAPRPPPAEPPREPLVLSEAPTPARPAAQPAPEVPARAAAATGEPRWMIQLGSFSEQDNAHRLADRVSTYGYQAEVSAFRAGGRTMHRVRVGPADSRNEAEATASSLAAHGFVAQVVAAD